MQLPELRPTKQPEDMAGQEFLLPWQKPIDILGCDPLRHVALFAIARASNGLTLPNLAPAIKKLHGKRQAVPLPGDGLPLQAFARNHFSETGCCSEATERIYFPTGGAANTVRLRASKACLPFLGVLGVWQLKHGMTLKPLLGQKIGRYDDRPYGGAATRRLRILQQIVVDGMASSERVQAAMPGVAFSNILRNLKEMHKEGLLDFYSRYNADSRHIQIIGDDPTRTIQRRSRVSAALAQACDNFLKQGKRRILLYELVIEAQAIAPDVTEKQLKDKLGNGQMSFFRFCDEDTLGASQGKKTQKNAFLLRAAAKEPVAELLTSIYSLDDPSFKRQAEAAAVAIMRKRALVKTLLTLPDAWEHASPFSHMPETPLKGGKELAEKQKDLDYRVIQKSAEREEPAEAGIDPAPSLSGQKEGPFTMQAKSKPIVTPPWASYRPGSTLHQFRPQPMLQPLHKVPASPKGPLPKHHSDKPGAWTPKAVIASKNTFISLTEKLTAPQIAERLRITEANVQEALSRIDPGVPLPEEKDGAPAVFSGKLLLAIREQLAGIPMGYMQLVHRLTDEQTARAHRFLERKGYLNFNGYYSPGAMELLEENILTLKESTKHKASS